MAGNVTRTLVCFFAYENVIKKNALKDVDGDINHCNHNHLAIKIELSVGIPSYNRLSID